MKKLMGSKLVPTLTIGTMLFLSSAVVSAQISDKTIDKLISLSGLSKQLEQLPGTVRAGIMQARQQGMSIPDAQFTEMADIVSNSFAPPFMLKAIHSEIKSNVTASDSKQLIEWYESKIGKRITQTEENASTPDAYKKMLTEAKSLLANENQMAIARRVEKAINSVDMAMQMQENAGIAVYTAIVTAANPGKQVDVEPFRAQLTSQRQQIRARMEQLILLSLVYSYKDVDVDTMNKYIAFLESPKTQKFNASVMKGMSEAIKLSTELMAQSLVSVFKPKEKPAAK